MSGRAALVPLRPGGEGESLLPGSYCLVWCDSDDVWHERFVLWQHGRLWEVVTPDGDRYLEDLSAGGNGPTKVVVLNADGDVDKIIAFYEDITDRLSCSRKISQLSKR